MDNGTTGHSHRSSTPYDTCQGVVIVCARIFVRTATATIDITTIGIIIRLTRIYRVCSSTFRKYRLCSCTNKVINSNVISTSDTYRSAIDLYIGIIIDMTILTTTVDRALDLWACCSIRCSDSDIGIIDPSQLIVGIDGICTCRRCNRGGYITT